MARTTRLKNERKPYPAQEKIVQDEPPSPLSRVELNVDLLEKKNALAKAKRDGTSTLMPQIRVLLARLNAFTPMRAFALYSRRHGPLMAAGSAYNMFFSVAALLVAGFSILGLVAAGNTQLQNTVVDAVSDVVPNLIDTGNGGLATREQLFEKAKDGYSIALVISIITTLITALNWINGLREGMRGIFGLPPMKLSFPVLKARDLGVLCLLGVALALTTALGGLITGFTQTVMNALNLESGFSKFVIQAAGFIIMLVLDALAAFILFRLASGITMPKKAVITAALLAGFGSTVLRIFSAQLLGSVANNPLLAPFAVILGLFVWFFLLSQVYLYSTALGRILTADEELREESHLNPKRPSLRRRALPGNTQR